MNHSKAYELTRTAYCLAAEIANATWSAHCAVRDAEEDAEEAADILANATVQEIGCWISKSKDAAEIAAYMRELRQRDAEALAEERTQELNRS